MQPQKESRYLVDREDEYDALVKASGIVVLHGPARCGKTTLLKKLAEDGRGVYFEFHGSDLPESIRIRLAEAMGKRPRLAHKVWGTMQKVAKGLASIFKGDEAVEAITTESRHMLEQFLDLLGKAETPIYLDGIREVADKQDILDLLWDILRRTSATIVIGIRDETRVEVDLNEHIRDDATFVSLDRFTPEQTEDLVRRKYGDWDPQVHERWEGDPGRLYLAMAEADTLGDLLTEIPRTLADQYHGAYTKLTPSQRPCAEMLAVLGEPVSLTDLAAILETDRTKLDLSPAIFDEDAAEARLYHPTCAEYIHETELKGDPAHHKSLHLRAAQFYVKRAEITDGEPTSIEDIRNALRAREHFHEAGKHDEAARIFTDTWEMLDRWGHWHLLARIGEDSVLATDPETRAAALHNAGIAQQNLGNYSEAQSYYEDSLEIFRELGDQASAARSLNQLGMVQQLRGKYADARRYYEESLEIAREVGNRASIAAAHNQLGTVEQQQGNYAEAQRCYEEGLEIAREVGHQAGIAICLHQLGTVQQYHGNYSEAQRHYEESLQIARDLGDRGGVASTLHQLGTIQQRQGNYAEAQRHYGESLQIFRELGDRGGFASTIHQLGRIEELQDNHAEAQRYYEMGLQINRELGNRAGIATSLGQMAMLAEQVDRPETAALAICAVRRLTDEIGMAEREQAEANCQRIADLIGQERFSQIEAEEQQMSLDEAIDRVLHELEDR